MEFLDTNSLHEDYDLVGADAVIAVVAVIAVIAVIAGVQFHHRN